MFDVFTEKSLASQHAYKSSPLHTVTAVRSAGNCLIPLLLLLLQYCKTSTKSQPQSHVGLIYCYPYIVDTRLVALESGLGLESGLKSIFAGLGLGLGLGL